ncbi:hypothetical protein DsansV1_C18g0155501 [Dioscorea sansibarensis]
MLIVHQLKQYEHEIYPLLVAMELGDKDDILSVTFIANIQVDLFCINSRIILD